MTTAEGAICHRAIAKTAAGFGAKFDAAITIFRRLHRAVNQRAFQKAGDLTVHNREIFRRANFAERVGAFRAKTVVVGRINTTIGDHRVAATINVYAVAVGIHRHVVHGQIVAAGDENRKMATVKNRDVANQNIFAKLERDGFVA